MKAVITTIPEYTDFSVIIAKRDQTQPSDPVKLVYIILDLVCQEGVGEKGENPFQLPLSTNAYNEIKAKCEETLELLGDWEKMIKSTDLEH
jgi:hypothetical protein